MRFLAILVCVAGITAAGVSPLWAGGIDNKHNWSAEYIRTLNRNAATDSADIVAYNPAGTTKMADGGYINFSVHGAFKTYGNKVNNVDLESDVPSYIPGLFAIYKKNRWSGFLGVTIPSGGGKVEYDNGNATTRIGGNTMINTINSPLNPLNPLGLILYDTIKNERVEAESYYYGITLGGAYAINDIFSVSLGARYVNANKEGNYSLQIQPSALGAGAGQTDRTAVFNYEDKADNWGAILGLNIAPTDKMLIGLRYETKTRLEFEYTVTQDTVGLGAAQGITNGTKHRRDLPAILALGISHQCTPKFRVETDLTYYFNEDADWGGEENRANNGYDVGIAFDYRFNDTIKASLGYMYTEVGIEARDILAEAPQLGASTVGAGLVYTARPGLDLNFAVGKVFYKDDSYIDTSSGTPLTIEYNKDIIFLALGIQYKFI